MQQEEPGSFTADANDDGSLLPISDLKYEDGTSTKADSPEDGTLESISLLPAAAWQTFFRLHAELDDVAYSQHCDKLFARWAIIAQALKDQESVIHPFGSSHKY